MTLGLWKLLRGGRTGGAEDDGAVTAALSMLRSLTDGAVEERLRAALRGAGFSVVDHGDDGVAGSDWILRRRGERTMLRLTHWRAKRVGVRQVRDLFEAMIDEGASGCKLVTCGALDAGAHDFARGKPIDLLGGAALLEALPLITEEPGASVPLRDPYESFVPVARDEAEVGAQSNAAPLCPRCRGTMQLRHAGADSGVAAGVSYWACTHFPRCPGTRPAP